MGDCGTCDIQLGEEWDGSFREAAVELHRALHRFGASVLVGVLPLARWLVRHVPGYGVDEAKAERWERLSSAGP